MANSSMVFQALDRDGNGRIGRADLEHAVGALVSVNGLTTASPAWMRIRAALGHLLELVEATVDQDDSGEVDPQELQRFTDQLGEQIRSFGGPPPAVIEVVHALWAALDIDGDGKIEVAEYTRFVEALGVPDDTVARFAELDTDGDGKIDVDELERRVLDWLRT
jgi:Ca2+-binding EF-hand superfamily protein